VERYAENSAKRLKQVKEAESPLNALYCFFETALTVPNEQRYMRQCLLVKSIAELDIIGDVAKKAVLDSMQTLKAGFSDIIEACIENGELPAHYANYISCGLASKSIRGFACVRLNARRK